MVLVSKTFLIPNQGAVMMDTTYFGRDFGVTVSKSTDGHHLYRKYVKYETIAGYMEGISYLKAQGMKVQGVVCDGRKGPFKALADYPVQKCQFHQTAIVTRYLTRKPKLHASVELKEIAWLLPRTDKESFFGALGEWHAKWANFINERAKSPETGKSRYILKRLRSAYKSIERNGEYLFTRYDNMELGLPNTNNQLEGAFTGLKNKLRNHNGLSRIRREKFIVLKGIGRVK